MGTIFLAFMALRFLHNLANESTDRSLIFTTNQGPSTSCSSKTIFRELSTAAKEAILEKHNQLRRRVAKGEETGGINSPQPGASNMKKLVRT